MSTTVIIPAYNEAEMIGTTLANIQQLETIDEIIVVNDGSSDETAHIVRQIAGVRLIDHPYNMGNGAAVKSGIRAATSEWVLLMDAEGQHPPEEVPRLLQHKDQYEMVVGARAPQSEAAKHRSLANRVFNGYASYVVGYPVPDLTSGFRLVRRSTALKFLYLLPNGYSYPSTLTIALFRSGFAVKYQPFVSPARKTGSSGIKPLRDGLRFMMKITNLAVIFVPMKIFLPVSLFFLIPGVSYTLFLLTQRRFSGFGGLVTIVGMLIFLLGLISEQIASVRMMYADR